MEEKDYKDFFDKFTEFKAEQSEQKARGLNDYNMVNVVRKATHEVGMHSNVIYSLINPDGLHYQGDLFLKKFIKEVLDPKEVLGLNDFGEILAVEAEESTNENKRIDFTIKSSKYYIGIEMKINHHDSYHQLYDYYNDLNTKSIDNENQKVLIYYLTKDGKKAEEKSSNGIDYIRVSFEEHILNWIDKCQNEVRNIVNLNEAFNNYRTIVKKITKQYEENVMSIKEYIFDDKNDNRNDNLEIILELDKEMNSIKGRVLYDFFESIYKTLENETSLKFRLCNNILSEENILTLDKCNKKFSKKSNTPKNFGYAFDCDLNDKYLFIKIANKGLYYGLIDGKYKNLTNQNNCFYQSEKLDNILKNQTYERNSNEFGSIYKFSDLLDLNISKSIIEDIKKIKELGL